MINKKKSDIRVHVHEHNLLKSDGEEAYYVKTIHIHPLFLNPGNQDYSYAVLNPLALDKYFQKSGKSPLFSWVMAVAHLEKTVKSKKVL